jgi:hypothetical protein
MTCLKKIGSAVEDVDYRTARKLGRALFHQLAIGRWIEERRNLLITGPCGVGKTWLACALGQKACRDNRTVLYRRLPRLFAELELAHGDGRFPQAEGRRRAPPGPAMTAAANPTPAPVHQQVPPARAAASAPETARRAARGTPH